MAILNETGFAKKFVDRIVVAGGNIGLCGIA